MGRLRFATAVVAAVIAFIIGLVPGAYVGVLLTWLVIVAFAPVIKLLDCGRWESLCESGLLWGALALNGFAIFGSGLLCGYVAFRLIRKPS